MHYFSKRCGIFFVVTLIGCVAYSSFLHSEGFAKGTILLTEDRECAIEDITPLDTVICYDEEHDVPVVSSATVLATERIEAYIQITINNRVIKTAPDQKVYMPLLRQWVSLGTIFANIDLLEMLEQIFPFDDIQFIEEPLDIYKVTIKDYHNFYIVVGEHRLLVHNNFVIGIKLCEWGAGAIAWVTKEVLLEALVSGALGWLGWKAFQSHRHTEEDDDIVNEVRKAQQKIPDKTTTPAPQSPTKSEGSDKDTDQTPKPRGTKREHVTNEEKAKQAKKLGYPNVVKDPPFKTHGEKVFGGKDKTTITYDKDGHKGGFWKMHKGDTRMGTYNKDLTIKIAN